MQVSLSNYGQGKTPQWNTTQVHIGNLSIWFSYKTIIAFCNVKQGMVVSENQWGPTTGKHLNWINTTRQRLPRTQFNEEFNIALDNALEEKT